MNYSVDDQILICPRCDKGREACTFCWNQDWTIFRMICDCGLYDAGEHTIPCELVEDELAHAAHRADPRLEAEADHGGRNSIDHWTEEDDVLLGELLDDGEG